MTPKPHPLINELSPHYAIYKGLEGIEVIEQVLDTDALIGACKFNILKYQLRLGKKGDIVSDIKKIETYQAYLEELLGRKEAVLVETPIDQAINETAPSIENMDKWMADALQQMKKKG